MELTAERAFAIFNACEGLLWMGISLGLLVVLYRKRQNAELMLVLAALFAAFGASDWIEIGTGGWYKPWWMLTWKVTNFLGLAMTLVLLRRREREAAQANHSGA